MHELSIAMSLVEGASEQACALGDVRVVALHVRIGPLSGVVREALEFSFGLASEGTRIDGALLVVEDMPITAYCERCAEVRTILNVQHLRCPSCGELTPDVTGGRELELFALEVESGVPTHS